ncbi:MAG: ABC transporter ATP-binding protein [Oscillospiraceae bacterium]|nr:ABC transporter ATP-binding protein [Oscillospiraceae bacterium]
MIEFLDATKKFDDKVAVDNINLQIPTGSCFGLLGSNGAGKSTMLRMISGVYECDGGKVAVDGVDVYNNNSVKERIFFINDETIQFTTMTLKELKNFYKPYYPNFSDEIFDKLNAIIKLPEKRKLSTFSKGMKRQAVVIVGLACQTDYIMLDEAFDGLDPTMRIIVKKMIIDAMASRNLTAIISSHNLMEMSELCDRVALVHNGKIVFSNEVGSHDIIKIQTAFAQEVTTEMLIEQGIEVLHFDAKGSVCNIIIKGEIDEVRAKLDKFEPSFVDTIDLTLDEIFIYEMEGLGYDFDSIGE